MASVCTTGDDTSAQANDQGLRHRLRVLHAAIKTGNAAHMMICGGARGALQLRFIDAIESRKKSKIDKRHRESRRMGERMARVH